MSGVVSTNTVNLGIERLESIDIDYWNNDKHFPGFLCIPPHTLREEKVAMIYRGDNFHGDLVDDFYLCLNDFQDDEEYFVLWIGENESQAEDSHARLTPIAVTKIEPFDDEETGVRQERIAAAALLHVWVSHSIIDEDRYSADDDCEGGLISEEQVDLIIKNALTDKPFRFIDPLNRYN